MLIISAIFILLCKVIIALHHWCTIQANSIGLAADSSWSRVSYLLIKKDAMEQSGTQQLPLCTTRGMAGLRKWNTSKSTSLTREEEQNNINLQILTTL